MKAALARAKDKLSQRELKALTNNVKDQVRKLSGNIRDQGPWQSMSDGSMDRPSSQHPASGGGYSGKGPKPKSHIRTTSRPPAVQRSNHGGPYTNMLSTYGKPKAPIKPTTEREAETGLVQRLKNQFDSRAMHIRGGECQYKWCAPTAWRCDRPGCDHWKAFTLQTWVDALSPIGEEGRACQSVAVPSLQRPRQ